ncbi:piggyBac transposable element-derived protein 3-like [Centroberyx affinis]|uniref:piggyBac transposable element-derived protein 3-like n=1 Tax=Centroberyx affinis TaxID=166261 RepID=UPI003A5C2529
MLDLGDHPAKACNIVVIPQNEKDAVLSDCDSDGSDMDYEGETGHLPARLLNAYAELMQTDHDRNNVISDDDLPLTTPPPLLIMKSQGPLPARGSSQKSQGPLQAIGSSQKSQGPLQAIGASQKSQGQSCREITIEMSNLYSTQTKDKQLYLSMDELLTFYGILITSGYSSVPRRHMYWSLDSDVHNESISDTMRRNRFDEIMASVHVVDNTKITDDPFFKVRPIFSELNQSYKVMPFQEWLSVDESMIPYYGRHGCKQFIRGKPIRFGYKLWSLASSSGYMYHMEPYGGSHTLLPKTGLGQGPSVVLGLAEQGQVPQGCKFFHDNLFTSLALLDEMTKRGYGSSGTMRQNRLFDVPFKPQKDFKKLTRGTSEVLTQGDKLLVRWKDNNIVTVATNMEEKYSETSVKRWNKERRAFDKVPQPKCINRYNEHMGGVDLHDLQRRYGRDHRPAHLLAGSGTVSYAKVWHETTEPWKEISTGCYC